MRTLLVTSPHLDHSALHEHTTGGSTTARLAQCFAPMGLMSVAEVIRPYSAVQIACINKAINQHRLQLSDGFYECAAEWLLEHDPDLVGFMTETDSYHHLLRIFECLKARRPTVLTLLGGVHATAVHRETVEAYPAVDFIVRGEGETATAQLVEALGTRRSFATVGNLTYRARGFVVSNAMLPLIDDLDTLPWPDFSQIHLAKEDVIYLEVGRGCPFRCNFCSTAPYWQRKHRIKSADRVIREMRGLKDQYARSDFNLTHDLLTTDRSWVLDFCKHLVEANLGVSWTCSSRTDTIDDEQLHWMRRAGCRNIYYGVETGTAEMQRLIGKDLDLGHARTIVGRTADLGISPTIGFIAGLPGETTTTLRGTLDEAMWFLGLPGATVHLFAFSPYNGSANFDSIREKLDFDPHFVDFPLPAETHAANCALMRRQPAIFSRYGRLCQEGDLRGEVVRAAEEFLPNINALRDLMLEITATGDNLFRLLSEWTDWVAIRNRATRTSIAGTYQGTIADFLEFLESYLSRNNIITPQLTERLRWEGLKNHVRTFLRSGYYGVEGAEGRPATTLWPNPSMAVGAFEYEHLVADEAAGPNAKSFAFYALSDGSSKIVRLPVLGDVVLSIATGGVPRQELVAVLANEAESLGDAVMGIASRLVDLLAVEELLVDGSWRRRYGDSDSAPEGFMPPRPLSARTMPVLSQLSLPRTGVGASVKRATR